jgi:hypothetical protein
MAMLVTIILLLMALVVLDLQRWFEGKAQTIEIVPP